MPHHPDPTPAPPRRGAVLGWGLVAALGVAAIGSAGLGGLDETDAVDADRLRQPIGLLDDHRVLVGALGVGLVAATIGGLLRLRRRGELDSPQLGQVVVLILTGAWVALTYAIVTAPTVGANIGGALLLLATPVVLLGAAALLVVLQVAGRRASGREPQSS